MPRPETEQLVSLSLEHVDEVEPRIVVDVGTGSGAIALAIGSERSTAHVSASIQARPVLKWLSERGASGHRQRELREGHLLETLDIRRCHRRTALRGK